MSGCSVSSTHIVRGREESEGEMERQKLVSFYTK